MIRASVVNADGYLSPIGWKTYKIIKKKAMEQEFSWSGLLISLSIAFFVVVAAAFALRFINTSMINLNLAANGWETEANSVSAESTYF